MQFLVEITVELPEELRDADSARRRELLAAELARGLELRRAGTIEAIWRVPSTGLRNAGVWNARDEEALRELIQSLPMAPWITAEITPLSEHPIERELRASGEERTA